MTNTSINTRPANDNALCCEACGATTALSLDRLCAVCDADLAAGLDALSAAARWHVGDPEGETTVRGVRC